MRPSQLVPAQVRAARALLNWSQDNLRKKAGVALSSVRDFENEKRPDETQVAGAMLRTLEEAGVTFVPGDEQEGPGVRLVGDRPHLVRRPMVVTMWDGVPFDVEWRGKRLTVFISTENIEDLGELSGDARQKEYLRVLEDNMGRILGGLRKALLDGVTPRPDGRLRLPSKYIFPDQQD